jgi:hypothetical protein
MHDSNAMVVRFPLPALLAFAQGSGIFFKAEDGLTPSGGNCCLQRTQGRKKKRAEHDNRDFCAKMTL